MSQFGSLYLGEFRDGILPSAVPDSIEFFVTDDRKSHFGDFLILARDLTGSFGAISSQGLARLVKSTKHDSTR